MSALFPLAKDELERASEVVASLRLQIRGLREKLQDEMKVLDQAKVPVVAMGGAQSA